MRTPTWRSRSIWTSCSARSRSSRAGRTGTGSRWPRSGRASRHRLPGKLRPGLAPAAVAHDDPEGPGGVRLPRRDPGEPVRRRDAVDGLVGVVDADLRSGGDEEAVAGLLFQGHGVAAVVDGRVLLAGALR